MIAPHLSSLNSGVNFIAAVFWSMAMASIIISLPSCYALFHLKCGGSDKGHCGTKILFSSCFLP